MSELEKAILQAKLEQIGVERLLEDQGQSFINTVGGPAEQRSYAGIWLSQRIALRENTARHLSEGKKAFRSMVMQYMYDQTNEGAMGYTLDRTDIATDLECEQLEIDKALDYLRGEGLLEAFGIHTYGLTHEGVVEIEKLREHPNHETEHFPSITINNHGNNVIVHGSHNTVMQVSHSKIPAELTEFVVGLEKLDGGRLSPESDKLLTEACEATSLVKLASAAEDVAQKSTEHSKFLSSFKEELGKQLAERGVDAATATAGWLYYMGPKLIAAFQLILQQH